MKGCFRGEMTFPQQPPFFPPSSSRLHTGRHLVGRAKSEP
uniref:Uncharacterized protein n=1 Tax=Anguilla anguilla TaxID=7936 RepID=A0A0E9VQH6_ANGAN